MSTLVAAGAVGLAILLLVLLLQQRRSSRFLLMRERLRLETERNEREALVRAQAIADERQRIYNDLHDDLGASLLQLIYTAPDAQYADALRAVLQNVRDVVTRSRGTPGTLSEVLADIQGEANQRLAAVGIGLTWDVADELPDPVLDTDVALHLYRIVREAISNVIRHAHAGHLRVRVRGTAERLAIELTDDGTGHGEPGKTGSGIRTMRERADELDADIAWKMGTLGGTKVLLEWPLPGAKSR